MRLRQEVWAASMMDFLSTEHEDRARRREGQQVTWPLRIGLIKPLGWGRWEESPLLWVSSKSSCVSQAPALSRHRSMSHEDCSAPEDRKPLLGVSSTVSGCWGWRQTKQQRCSLMAKLWLSTEGTEKDTYRKWQIAGQNYCLLLTTAGMSVGPTSVLVLVKLDWTPSIEGIPCSLLWLGSVWNCVCLDALKSCHMAILSQVPSCALSWGCQRNNTPSLIISRPWLTFVIVRSSCTQLHCNLLRSDMVDILAGWDSC